MVLQTSVDREHHNHFVGGGFLRNLEATGEKERRQDSDEYSLDATARLVEQHIAHQAD